ncbi:class F sortase [Paenibacillus sp. NPDC058174]|uniref:class F sortase n=1 Tax=Paenibacillus sp. NPDC058174 TaxID=3346366 RepID=UPI0036DC4820
MKTLVQSITPTALTGIVPVELFIPAIQLQAQIEPVSVLENGQMDIPQSTDKVGFLSTGTLPGALGNAVMDGHVDSYTGPAVFFKLKRLKPGDEVLIRNKSGRVLQFNVESVETFKTADAPVQKIFGPADGAHLNLITCTGKYSRSKKEHEARLVVFTKLQEVRYGQ